MNYTEYQNISLMAYNQSLGGDNNIWKLKGINEGMPVPQTIIHFPSVDTLATKQDPISKTAMPVFNNDRHYFTPAFLLPLDSNFYKLNEAFEQYQFEEQIKRNIQFLKQNKIHSTAENLKLFSPTIDYCQICRKKYANYFEHTSQSTHMQLVKNNPINRSIQKLCSGFKQNKIKIKICKKDKKTNSDSPKHKKPVTRSSKVPKFQSTGGQSCTTRTESS